MTARRLLRHAPVLILILALAIPLYAAKPKPMSVPKIDPKATELLRQMSEYLTSLQNFSVHVDTQRDIVLPSDQALISDQAYDLSVRRPNGFLIDMTSAAGEAQVYYDGKTITVYTPKKNYYAVTPAMATIEDTMRAALKRGISMPLADLFYNTPHKRLLANVASATFVGSSMVNGVMTNHLAFRQKNGIDWQIWIEDSTTPLPKKVVIVDRRTKDYPRFVATLSDWNVDPTFDESTFTFTAPSGAQKINFSELPKQPRKWSSGTKPAHRK